MPQETVPMSVQLQDIGPVKKRLSVEIPAKEVARSEEDLVRSWSRTARIPGFRKGHVPASVIRQRFGKEIEDESKHRLVEEFCNRAIQAQGLEPAHDPVVEEVSREPGGSLKFQTLFEIRPKIDLGTYKGLVKVETPAEVTSEDVDRALESLRGGAARLIPVEPARPAQSGDVVVADLDGHVIAGEGENFKHQGVLITLGAEDTPAPLTAALEGASPGDRRQAEVQSPQDSQRESPARRTVRYDIIVRELKTRLLPDLDDEFAKEIGEPGGIAPLRDRIKADLQAARRRRALSEAREAALTRLAEAHPVEIPEVLAEAESRRLLEDLVTDLAGRGVDVEKANLDFREIREKQRPLAKKRAHGLLLLDAIIRKEGWTVRESEIRERVRAEARAAGASEERVRERLEREGGTQALAVQILRGRALDILIDEASITT